jgi:hypothetical protein
VASDYHPVLNARMSTVGYVRVGPAGQLIVEPEDDYYAGELDAKASAELAIEILKRARPLYRLIEDEDVGRTLEHVLDEE